MSVELAEVAPAGRQQEEYLPYRAINTLAVVSLGLGFLSLLTFLGWGLGIFGILGVILGLVAVSQIRHRPSEMTGLPLAWTGVILSAVLATGGWTWHTVVYMTEVPPGYERISYNDFQPTRQEPQVFPPRKVQELDGKKVFIKGYMYPGGNPRAKSFVLCRDNGDCCFGGEPKITDMILVNCDESLEPEFSTYQRKFAGILRIDPTAGGDVGTVVFQLEADYMK